MQSLLQLRTEASLRRRLPSSECIGRPIALAFTLEVIRESSVMSNEVKASVVSSVVAAKKVEPAQEAFASNALAGFAASVRNSPRGGTCSGTSGRYIHARRQQETQPLHRPTQPTTRRRATLHERTAPPSPASSLGNGRVKQGVERTLVAGKGARKTTARP